MRTPMTSEFGFQGWENVCWRAARSRARNRHGLAPSVAAFLALSAFFDFFAISRSPF
jgi:hypothetical protein